MHVPLPGFFHRPMTEKDAETEIMMQFPEQLLEIGRVLKEENRNFIYIFLLKQSRLQI
jgi:hypothetical protein